MDNNSALELMQQRIDKAENLAELFRLFASHTHTAENLQATKQFFAQNFLSLTDACATALGSVPFTVIPLVLTAKIFCMFDAAEFSRLALVSKYFKRMVEANRKQVVSSIYLSTENCDKIEWDNNKKAFSLHYRHDCHEPMGWQGCMFLFVHALQIFVVVCKVKHQIWIDNASKLIVCNDINTYDVDGDLISILNKIKNKIKVLQIVCYHVTVSCEFVYMFCV